MARILDDERRVEMHPNVSRQLHCLLQALGAKQRKKVKGRLANVQLMTNRRSPLTGTGH
jgi:hypothetical protein